MPPAQRQRVGGMSARPAQPHVRAVHTAQAQLQCVGVLPILDVLLIHRKRLGLRLSVEIHHPRIYDLPPRRFALGIGVTFDLKRAPAIGCLKSRVFADPDRVRRRAAGDRPASGRRRGDPHRTREAVMPDAERQRPHPVGGWRLQSGQPSPASAVVCGDHDRVLRAVGFDRRQRFGVSGPTSTTCVSAPARLI